MEEKVTRYALIRTTQYESVEAYLPDNYRVVLGCEEGTLIVGADNAGWTLDEYVLPRLASGLYFGDEVSKEEALQFVRGGS